MNIETNGNVTTIYGPDMTNDFEQMKRECCGRYDNFIFHVVDYFFSWNRDLVLFWVLSYNTYSNSFRCSIYILDI